MRCQGCLMPSMCVLCEGIFDASYDFREESGAGEEESSQKKKGTLFCWDCRLNLAQKKAKK